MVFLFQVLWISGVHLHFPGCDRHFMLLTSVCWWREATPLAGGICTHIGPQVYWRSLTDFWGRVLFQQKPFKCFSVTGLLDYQQHDIGVSGGTSVLLLEDDPACFWGVKVYFRRKKSFWGGSLKIYAPHSLKTNITPENRPSKNRKESPSNHPCSERLLLVLRRVALFNGFLSQQVI